MAVRYYVTGNTCANKRS